MLAESMVLQPQTLASSSRRLWTAGWTSAAWAARGTRARRLLGLMAKRVWCAFERQQSKQVRSCRCRKRFLHHRESCSLSVTPPLRSCWSGSASSFHGAVSNRALSFHFSKRRDVNPVLLPLPLPFYEWDSLPAMSSCLTSASATAQIATSGSCPLPFATSLRHHRRLLFLRCLRV